MTIASTTSRISYTGDGVTVAFAVPFYFQLNSDLVVTLQDTTGAATTQALGTNYTLTGATLSAGGTCTFLVAPTTGYLLTIYRDPPLTQSTSYNNNDPFPAKSHELALDKAVTIDQRTRDLINRAIHINDSEDVATVTALATIPNRKNKLLGFDSNGALTYVVGPTFVGNTSTGVAEVESKATAQITTFAVSVNIVRTLGNAAPGDGGGLAYKRGTIASPTPWQDAGGSYWTPATVEPLAALSVATATIQGSAVTYAKIQNAASQKLLGNPTGGSTAVSEVPIGTGLAFSSATTLSLAAMLEPQGYLTLVTNQPIQTADVTATTTVFYTPMKGNLIAIYNGTDFILTSFAQLSCALVASHVASNIYDFYVINDAGTIRLVTGVSWSAGTAGSITAGSCARGTGASGSALVRTNGVWTNAVSTTMRYGANTTTVAAGQGTYVGSMFVDGTNGQVSCHTSYGQSRKWGLWNAYNRTPILLQAGDSTASYTYATATIRASRNDATNNVTVFTGLAEEVADTAFYQKVQGVAAVSTSATLSWRTGIGLNVTNAFSGQVGSSALPWSIDASSNFGVTHTATSPATFGLTPRLGINVLQSLESTDTFSDNTVTYFGTNANMLLTARYRG